MKSAVHPPFAVKTLGLSALLFAALPFASFSVRAEEPGKDLAAKLQPFVESHTLAGAVTLVATKDKILDLSAVGYADVAAKKPMATDDLFWIASMSKPITATALMMLVDEGKVNVDDPVEKYLPEFKGQMLAVEKDADHILLKKPTHPITVKNVLSHTSGLPFSSPIERPTLDLLPLASRVQSYAMLPLDFDPDSNYKYANAGINTAGRIIEVVSGMLYEDFLDQRIFKPLGMKDTTFWPNEEQLSRLAKSYKANQDKSDIEETPIGQLKYPLNDRTRQPMPAGGLFSTASDLAKFCQMILNNGELDGKRYLSEASVKQMTSRETPEGLKQSYGFGWSANGTTFGHGGAYSTNMSIDTNLGLITIFMVQNAGWRSDEGKKIQPAFNKAAVDAFSKP
jgi:CubicO group peptidase (beta-lactamase class C family)